MMIDIIGLKHNPRKFRQQVIFFVGGAIRPNYSDRAAAAGVAYFAKPSADRFESFFPGRRRKLAAFSNQRMCQALLVVREVEGITSLDAKKIAIDAALIAIVAAHNLCARLTLPHT